MKKWQVIILVFFQLVTGSTAQAELNALAFSEAERISDLLDQAEDQIDFARTKLTIDKIIDPTIDIEGTLKQIHRMVEHIRTMLGSNPTSKDKVLAIKKYLYEVGPWNDSRPYRYDFDDPLGTKISNKLLSNYMASRKGNCVSMPFLFIILGQKLGIDVTASTAPLHVLVKYTDTETGITVNLETTSGANPTRDEWYRKQMPMTDEAIANGLYLQKLSKKETAVVMATILAEYYFERHELEKTIIISDIQLAHYPKYDVAMLTKGSSFYLLLEREFVKKYPNPNMIPINERARLKYLSDSNRFWFEKAESLGWREPRKDHEADYLRTVEKDAK